MLGLTLFLVTLSLLLGPSPARASSLSGLMALKEMAQEAIPYEMAIANQKPYIP